jgi:hypothetical protein
MTDGLDAPAVLACCEAAGLRASYGQLTAAARRRVVCVARARAPFSTHRVYLFRIARPGLFLSTAERTDGLLLQQHSSPPLVGCCARQGGPLGDGPWPADDNADRQRHPCDAPRPRLRRWPSFYSAWQFDFACVGFIECAGPRKQVGYSPGFLETRGCTSRGVQSTRDRMGAGPCALSMKSHNREGREERLV